MSYSMVSFKAGILSYPHGCGTGELFLVLCQHFIEFHFIQKFIKGVAGDVQFFLVGDDFQNRISVFVFMEAVQPGFGVIAADLIFRDHGDILLFIAGFEDLNHHKFLTGAILQFQCDEFALTVLEKGLVFGKFFMIMMTYAGAGVFVLVFAHV